MTDDNLDDTQQYTSTLQEHDKAVWNEAIEAAAKEVESKSHILLPLVVRIRNLKK